MKLLSTFSLSSAAKGLCYVGKNEIVVSNKERQLLFMKISDNTLKLENKLKVKYPVDALACDVICFEAAIRLLFERSIKV